MRHTLEEWGKHNDGSVAYTMMVPPEQGAKLNAGEQADLVGIVDSALLLDTGSSPVIISGDYVVRSVEHIKGTCMHAVSIHFLQEPCAFDKELRWHRLIDGELSCDNTRKRDFVFYIAPPGANIDDPTACPTECKEPEQHGEGFVSSAPEGDE